jgi:hypothetical protein
MTILHIYKTLVDGKEPIVVLMIQIGKKVRKLTTVIVDSLYPFICLEPLLQYPYMHVIATTTGNC